MLMRYSEAVGYKRAIDFGRSDDFIDYYEVDDYAWEAVCWAATHNIMEGKGEAGAPKEQRKIDPHGKATKTELQTMINRMLEVNGYAKPKISGKPSTPTPKPNTPTPTVKQNQPTLTPKQNQVTPTPKQNVTPNQGKPSPTPDSKQPTPDGNQLTPGQDTPAPTDDADKPADGNEPTPTGEATDPADGNEPTGTETVKDDGTDEITVTPTAIETNPDGKEDAVAPDQERGTEIGEPHLFTPTAGAEEKKETSQDNRGSKTTLLICLIAIVLILPGIAVFFKMRRKK